VFLVLSIRWEPRSARGSKVGEAGAKVL